MVSQLDRLWASQDLPRRGSTNPVSTAHEVATLHVKMLKTLRFRLFFRPCCIGSTSASNTCTKPYDAPTHDPAQPTLVAFIPPAAAAAKKSCRTLLLSVRILASEVAVTAAKVLLTSRRPPDSSVTSIDWLAWTVWRRTLMSCRIEARRG